ncbi:hypothetical protein BJX68DRAFT_90142 [Aspergillus pseudodeflectus]|uniref:Rhodopsin domain-containing protein n=1 Tax=Aspergillus pseudodeflectus TaxID=176178 RepID=A0ABR4L7Y8_9EURO
MASNDDGPGGEVEDISCRIWIGTIVTVVPATIAVALRFVSRHISRAGFWWDDWVIAVSLVVNWGMDITRWVQVLMYQFGRHHGDVPVSDVVEYQKSFIAIQLIYFTNAVLTKSSLLLLYQRIFGIVRSFRIALAISWFLIIGYFIACAIASIAGCLPVSYVWTRYKTPPGPGSCFNEVAFFRWNGIANMLLDILMLILPLPMVWRMRMSRRRRLLLTGIFGMGGFVCVVSLLRIISFNQANRDDPTFTQIYSSTWSSVEQGVGIVCACLPTLRPLRRLWTDMRKRGSTGTGTATSKRDKDNLSSPPESKRSSRCASERSHESALELGNGHGNSGRPWLGGGGEHEIELSLRAAVYTMPDLFRDSFDDDRNEKERRG